MITKGNRRAGVPVLVHNESASKLKRIALGVNEYNEAWIQQLIHTNPGILPIDEIESAFMPAIPIGKEVQTKAGYIDNLLISPEGYLTIVETKLWRNPEARREVVGQILDYAKEISKWTFTDLDNSVKQFNLAYNSNSDGLLVTMRKQNELDEFEEQLFIDSISKNLKRGRFLLLIVGDGIRESVEDMVDYLSHHPQLYFTLAMVELQVYKLNETDGSLLILPQLVTRTKEITRAIVRIEGNQSADFKLSIETDLGSEIANQQSQGYKRQTLTAEDYFEQLVNKTDIQTVAFAKQIIKDSEALGLFVEWNSSTFSVKLPDPQGSSARIPIANFDRTGMVYLGFSQSQFEKLGLPAELRYQFAADTASLLSGITQNPQKLDAWNKYSTFAALKPVYDQFMSIVKNYIESISNELRVIEKGNIS